MAGIGTSNSLFTHIKQGIALAVKKYGDAVVSVGVDTWGVDYGLLDADGKLLCAPFQYRDSRTARNAGSRVPPDAPRGNLPADRHPVHVFQHPFPAAGREKSPARLEKAGQLLFMPDLIHYFLTGRRE